MKYLPLKGPWVLSHSSGTSLLGIPYECMYTYPHIHTKEICTLPYPVVLMSQQKGGWTSVSGWGEGHWGTYYIPSHKSTYQSFSQDLSSVVTWEGHLLGLTTWIAGNTKNSPLYPNWQIYTFLLERDDELICSLGACLNTNKLAICPLYPHK